ncbi:hypothetical protein [Tenuifilum thalassicum]|uniref:Uncharacterized protein n=1 Tax=Tenuifilum thalassicum TaxID=2590900 RepID=A0A7D4BL97_9BACT|nr:hypothetical protein [Tenuifilum thalassicum]QKG80859.1 hypothetical protein FHG85_11485 [Tenuifilum thalassicum]
MKPRAERAPAKRSALVELIPLHGGRDLIHNPQSTTGLFEGMEEGAMKVNADAEIKDILDAIRNANEAGTETCVIKKYGVENFFIDYNFKLYGDEEIKISVLKYNYSELNIKVLKKECNIYKGGDNYHFGAYGSFTTFTFWRL